MKLSDKAARHGNIERTLTVKAGNRHWGSRLSTVKRRYRQRRGNASHELERRYTGTSCRRGVADCALRSRKKVRPFLIRQLQLGSRFSKDAKDLFAELPGPAIASEGVWQSDAIQDAEYLSQRRQSLIEELSWSIRHYSWRYIKCSATVNDGVNSVFGRLIREGKKSAVTRMLVQKHQLVLLAGNRRSSFDVRKRQQGILATYRVLRDRTTVGSAIQLSKDSGCWTWRRCGIPFLKLCSESRHGKLGSPGRSAVGAQNCTRNYSRTELEISTIVRHVRNRCAHTDVSEEHVFTLEFSCTRVLVCVVSLGYVRLGF